jgi:hypothetical protein
VRFGGFRAGFLHKLLHQLDYHSIVGLEPKNSLQVSNCSHPELLGSKSQGTAIVGLGHVWLERNGLRCVFHRAVRLRKLDSACRPIAQQRGALLSSL